MSSATKECILESTAELFRRQGYVGVGIKQIAAEASAPSGSVYHCFPRRTTEPMTIAATATVAAERQVLQEVESDAEPAA
jgi:AcrR family transcriptional regulator